MVIVKTKNTIIKLTTFCFIILINSTLISQEELQQIRPFGTNPGNLKLMLYEPPNITEKSPLVVVLHGCTQMAKACAEQTGWNKLAKQHQFYVLYPEQIILNNLENCFNWYREGDQTRDKGEPGSIKQMIDYLKKNKNIDSTRIYVIGLSAGGAMSSIMMAVYPEVFDKGGVIGGGPYKAAESAVKGGASMLGMVAKSPENWGDLIRSQNPNYKGKYPELAVFHGNLDYIVNINNANQLIKQWTNIHQSDYKIDEHYEEFMLNKDVELTIYKDANQQDIVKYYKIKNMAHAVAIDTGSCQNQGGKTGMFAVDKNFHSTFWAAHFFGIIKPINKIEGETKVVAEATNITYSIPYTEGSVYSWKTPSGVWIQGEAHSNSIKVNFDYTGGYIEVNETSKNGCMEVPSKIWVNLIVK
jgi:poly(hydroxyalkanoate) depolymerase family esterase